MTNCWPSCAAHREKRGMAVACLSAGLGRERILGCIRRPLPGEDPARRLLVAVNYAPHPSQCYLKLPFPEIRARWSGSKTRLAPPVMIRDGDELLDAVCTSTWHPGRIMFLTLESPSMKAITVEPKKPGTARFEDIPEPDVSEGSVLVEAIAVGVCGTDAEIVEGKYGWAPPGQDAPGARP